MAQTASMVVVLVALGIGAAACDNEDQELRGHAARLSRAVDRLREVPNASKARALAELRREPCQGEQLCELQAVCVSAYQHHVEALERLERVRRAAKLDAPPPDTAAELERTRTALERAKEGVQRCTELEGAVKRAYDI